MKAIKICNSILFLIFGFSTNLFSNNISVGAGIGSDNGLAGLQIEYSVGEFSADIGGIPGSPLFSAGINWNILKSENERNILKFQIGSINGLNYTPQLFRVGPEFFGGYCGLKYLKDFGEKNGFVLKLGADFEIWKEFSSTVHEYNKTGMFIFPGLSVNYVF